MSANTPPEMVLVKRSDLDQAMAYCDLVSLDVATHERLEAAVNGEATTDHTTVPTSHARTPLDRDDAACPSCPYTDRGDWMVYRDEWEALIRERDRYREALEFIAATDHFDNALDPHRNVRVAIGVLCGEQDTPDG